MTLSFSLHEGPVIYQTLLYYIVAYISGFQLFDKTKRYGALRAPSSSSCGELCNAPFGCKLGTFGPNCACVYTQYTQTNGDPN
jgi:hypothetical protein